MGTSVRLPLEILGYIVDVLCDDGPRSRDLSTFDTLKMLCITCKFMVPVCRRYLFATVRFPSTGQWRGRHEFLLSDSIIVLHYTKNLSLQVTYPIGTLDYHCLQKISDVSPLAAIQIISSLSSHSWNSLPESTRKIILSLIQKPTLRRLAYQSIEYFPAAVLSLCSGLEELAIHNGSTLAPHSSDDDIHSLAITTLLLNIENNDTLASLMNPTGKGEGKQAVSIITLERLKKIVLYITCRDFIPPGVYRLLEGAICLEWLQIKGEFYIHTLLAMLF